jgi:hypothetical protein
VNADLKFVTVNIGAHGKQSDGGVYQYLALSELGNTKFAIA